MIFRFRPLPWACLGLMLSACAAAAQGTPQKTDCPDRTGSVSRDAATPPAQGDHSGSHNAGSTGWTNGVGGSFTGANPSGQTAAAPNGQPPVATGLDPAASARGQGPC